MNSFGYFFDGSDPLHTAPSIVGVLLGLSMYIGPLTAMLALLLAGMGDAPLIPPEATTPFEPLSTDHAPQPFRSRPTR